MAGNYNGKLVCAIGICNGSKGRWFANSCRNLSIIPGFSVRDFLQFFPYANCPLPDVARVGHQGFELLLMCWVIAFTVERMPRQKEAELLNTGHVGVPTEGYAPLPQGQSLFLK